MMIRKAALAGLVFALLGSAAAAQPSPLAYVGPWTTDTLWIVDPVTCSVTTCSLGTTGTTRGIEVGVDQAVYRPDWTINGIVRIDPVQCAVTTICSDPTNAVTGAPNNLVVNNEAVGGPGFWVIDDNAAPSSIVAPAPPPPATGWDNTALVDIDNRSCAVDCLVPNNLFQWSHAVQDPFNCGAFISVGYGTVDPFVVRMGLSGGGPVGPCRVGKVCSMTEPCQFDAFLGEDCTLWAWNSTSTGNVGFTVVDLRTGSCRTCSVGITHAGTGFAGVWAAPPEMPGNLGYVQYADGMCYTIDLDSCNVVTMCSTGITGATDAVSIERNELTSWLAGAGGNRVFNIRFSNVLAGDQYALVPSAVRACGAPLRAGTLEIHFTPDPFTFLGFAGGLPYRPIGTLAKLGTQVTWNLKHLGTCGAYWIAVQFRPGVGIVNVSNVIKCTL